MNIYYSIRINAVNTFSHNLYFRLADSFCCSNNLTVQIGYSYIVIVDKIESADSAACQCFNGIAADTADAEDSDVSIM